MTFTFDEALTTDLAFVRFHSGDTVEAESLISDELINGLVTLAGSKEAAAVQAIEYKITLMSQPKFKADWLEVDPATAIAGLRAMLATKRKELGVTENVIDSGVTHVFRADSQQTSEPDYSEGV